MKRRNIFVVFVALLIDLLPTLAMALQGDQLSGVQWRLQKPSEQMRPNEHPGPSQDVQKPPNNEKDHPSHFKVELIETLRTMANQEKAAYEQGRADAESWYSPSVLINVALFVVGALYTIAAFRQLAAINRQAGIAEKTLVMTLGTTRAIERAYVKMSHVSERWELSNEGHDWVLEMRVENFGNTPALITRCVLGYSTYPISRKLPEIPDYEAIVMGLPGETFLVKSDWFQFPQCFPIDEDVRCGIFDPDGGLDLYLIGYVDYVDKFGICHRAGYARKYDLTRKQLIYVLQSGYNYDEERKGS